MTNFTVGPVQSGEKVKKIGAENVPYFRTNEFSDIMKENEKLMLEFSKAPENSRCVFLTCSGTGGMEAAIINTLTSEDKVLVVNGGSFGQRFVEILTIHNIVFDEIRLKHGQSLKEEHLVNFENKGYTAFVVNVHETSTGVHYDMNLIAEFCKRNDLFLIVDAISSFLADELDMSESGIDVMITGSQKALACPPGVSLMVLSPKAIERVQRTDPQCLYLNLKGALKDGERGQTPFTPAVGVLLQIHARLCEIKEQGGVESEINRTKALANYFREKITGLPFEVVSESLSNAVTPLHPLTNSAYNIFTVLKDEYDIWVCPNGGTMRDTIFRVGHIGSLDYSDYDKLIEAFWDMKRRNLL